MPGTFPQAASTRRHPVMGPQTLATGVKYLTLPTPPLRPQGPLKNNTNLEKRVGAGLVCTKLYVGEIAAKPTSAIISLRAVPGRLRVVRVLAILSLTVILGCAHQQTASAPPKKAPPGIGEKKKAEVTPPPITPPPPPPGPKETTCRPQPPGGCNKLQTRSECVEHPRCGWTQRGAGYCHRIYCRDG